MCSDSITRRVRTPAGGFSLIEVLVVVVILGILAGYVAMKVVGNVDKAKSNRARSDIATIVQAVEAYKINYDRYPTNEQSLDVVDVKSRTDPWGKPYQYNSPGQEDPFEVFTLGRDGLDGGEGPDADIYSWQLNDVPNG